MSVYFKLRNTIKEDCKMWEQLANNGAMIYSSLSLKDNDDYSDLYSLMLNGHELWYGTLHEINAIVKSMIIRLKHQDFWWKDD